MGPRQAAKYPRKSKEEDTRVEVRCANTPRARGPLIFKLNSFHTILLVTRLNRTLADLLAFFPQVVSVCAHQGRLFLSEPCRRLRPFRGTLIDGVVG